MIIEPNRNMDIQYELEVWKNFILDKLIKKPISCKLCGYNNVSLVENKSINNPYICRYSNSKCSKVIYLKEHTLFNEFPRIACGIILYIIKLWLFDNKNTSEIKIKIDNEIPNINFSLLYTSNILKKLRQYIAQYIKDTYVLEDISEANKYERFAIDEWKFPSDNNFNFWVIGIININARKIRLEMSENRDQEGMKKIIRSHIKRGNIIISDGRSGYSWLDSPNNGYLYSTYTHALGDFGDGNDSTAHIEQLWAHLKHLIKKIYNSIPINNFFYFLKESKFRRNLGFLSTSDKWKEIFDILNYIRDLGLINFYTENELISITEK